MKKNQNTSFDPIAEAFYAFNPTLPEAHITLVRETFHLQPKDRIIDLGCGSGELALALRNYTSFVEGVDISKKMIDMAKERDVRKQVTWHHASVGDFDLGEERYNLIISFESFHLFPNPVDVITRCANALKPGGTLCVSWRMYEWDIPLKDIIKETFDAYGIDRGVWGRWMCPTFSQNITASKTQLTAPQEKKIAIPSHTALDIIASKAWFKKSMKHCDN